jgi:alkane 1-monooxygenase
VTLIWAPLQFVTTLFGVLWYVTAITAWKRSRLFFGIGVISGTIGITYAHELALTNPNLKGGRRYFTGDGALFPLRSEHLLVHHRYVGTT